MLANHRRSAFQKINAVYYSQSVVDVASHLPPFFVRKGTGLPQDRIGNTDLSDVVQQRALLQRDQFIVREAELASKFERVSHNSVRVTGGLYITCFERTGKRSQGRAIVCIQRFEHLIESFTQRSKFRGARQD